MKIFTGRVVKTKMAKTATVEVVRFMSHPIYSKRIKRTRLYHVHDELSARVGDTVRFAASKPYSKLKKWKVVEIVGNKKTSNKKKK